MTDDLEGASALRAIVEGLRVSRYPQLDGALVAEILDVQFQFAEDRPEGQKRTEQILSKWVSENKDSNRTSP